jgi:hypothetical protein
MAALCASAALGFGIAAPPETIMLHPQHKPVPERMVYRALVHDIAQLERIADRLDEKQPGKGDAVRAYYGKKMGLSAGGSATLRQFAKSCDSAVLEQDRKALHAVAQIHAKHPDGRLAKGEQPPAITPELKQFQAERDRVLAGCMASLQTSLSGADSRNLRQHIKSQFSRHLSNLAPNHSQPGSALKTLSTTEPQGAGR